MSEMITVDGAISRFRRDLTVSALLRGTLLAAAVFFPLAGPMLGLPVDGMFILIAIGAIWILLSYRSMQGSRLAADSPSLIASGQYDQAEQKIDTALRSFSLFRTVKLISMHHLALLRHAQHRWRESSLLCEAILRQKLGSMQGLSRTTCLLMADAMLELGDLPGALHAMARLNRQRLSLVEALTLQLLQLDYGARVGAWQSMLASLGTKVQLSELMPTANAARAQAMLALAAQKMQRHDLSTWLRRRVELLVNPAEIVADRPFLNELFNQTP